MEFTTLKAPVFVNLELTRACNWKCGFCFTESGCEVRHPELAHLERIVDELNRAEVFVTKLFGGEPFYYPYWREVVEYLSEWEFIITFVSNGTYLTEDAVRFLRKHRVNDGCISLHGLPEVHDQITGVPGSWQEAVAGLRACLSGGIRVSVAFVLTQENKGSIYDLAVVLDGLGLNTNGFGLNVSRLAPYGRGVKEWEDKKISYQDYLKAIEALERVETDLGMECYMGDAFPLCRIPERLHRYIPGCGAGTTSGLVDVDGNVQGCIIASGHFGNLLETPLTEIWQGEEMRKFRALQWLPAKCHQCETFCGGGCYASTFGVDRYAPDEFCGGGRCT